MPVNEDSEPVDVDALMLDIRQRVAEKKRRGLYSVDALAEDAIDESEPIGVDDLERIRALAVQHVDLAASASEKSGVAGAAITTVKRRLARGVSQPLYSLAAQASAYNAAVVGYLSRLGREVGGLGGEVGELRDQVERARAELEQASAELAATRTELRSLRTQLADVRASALAERISRLEQQDRVPIGSVDGDAGGADDGAGPATILGTIIDGRDITGALVDARAALVEELPRPLLHVGSGAGALLARVSGPSQGVEPDSELAAAAVREGHSVTCADPVRFAASLGSRALGSVIVTDLVERLSGDQLVALLLGLGPALRPGGPLVIEALDPEGEPSDLWRDPRQQRPLHPDGLLAACRSAGFSDLTVEQMLGEEIGHRYVVRGRG